MIHLLTYFSKQVSLMSALLIAFTLSNMLPWNSNHYHLPSQLFSSITFVSFLELFLVRNSCCLSLLQSVIMLFSYNVFFQFSLYCIFFKLRPCSSCFQISFAMRDFLRSQLLFALFELCTMNDLNVRDAIMYALSFIFVRGKSARNSKSLLSSQFSFFVEFFLQSWFNFYISIF